ncbi:MAG: hypothetical protein ABSH34_07380, partial [Verrucomicrobiota bacterium]
MKLLTMLLFVTGLALHAPLVWAGNVRVYPAPAGEELCKDFSVKIEGQEAPVYVAKVAPADPALRWKAMDDKAVWTRDSERGHIAGVAFKNIRAVADPLRVELHGFDEAHAVENVVFEGVVVNGKPLSAAEVITNAFVRN